MHPVSDPNAPNYRETYAYLCPQLPPPPDGNPETGARLERSAMQAVVALAPFDMFEARLAARIVGMEAHAADSLRLAGLAVGDPAEMHRCRAQATSMGRQADAALRALKRMQAVRDRQIAESHPAAMERAGYWFRQAVVPEPAPPAPAPEAEPAPPDLDAEADLYAAIYPDRAARIRAAGGLPHDCDFGPPETALVAAIVRRGSSHATPSRPANE